MFRELIIHNITIEPNGNGTYKTMNRHCGYINKFEQIYLRRNVTFEPSRASDFDWVNSCMEETKIAFRWDKSAIINSHRDNFIRTIFKENRENGLRLLSNSISAILKERPDVEFNSSYQQDDFMKHSVINDLVDV